MRRSLQAAAAGKCTFPAVHALAARSTLPCSSAPQLQPSRHGTGLRNLNKSKAVSLHAYSLTFLSDTADTAASYSLSSCVSTPSRRSAGATTAALQGHAVDCGSRNYLFPPLAACGKSRGKQGHHSWIAMDNGARIPPPPLLTPYLLPPAACPARLPTPPPPT